MKRQHSRRAGFTLMELLIAIGILTVLLLIVLASVKGAKDKASDADVKKVISELAVKAEGKELAPGVVDYTRAFSTIDAPATIAALATKTLGTNDTSAYSYEVTATNYVIVFPLKKGTYWCVDSAHQGAAVEVVGLMNTSGPRDCSNATLVVDGGGGVAGGGEARTLTVHAPIPVSPTYDVSFYESLPHGYAANPSKYWPLLIYIHGGGEALSPITSILNNGPLKHVAPPENNQMEFVINGQPQSFIILAPHDGNFFPDIIDAVVEYAKSNYRVDANRIYLTGVSSGTVRATEYIASADAYANKFAAFAPVDGSNELLNSTIPYSNPPIGIDYCAINRTSLPIWIHNSSGHTDGSWMASFMNALGACTPTLSPALSYSFNTGNGAWNQAYDPTHGTHPYPNLYEWMLLNSLGSTPPPPPFPVQPPPLAYGGTPQTIPGTIEAEYYDTGGQGVSYDDFTPINNGGQQFRPYENVDLEATGDPGGGYDLGWTLDGEWVNYTVTASAGTYTLETRVASMSSGNSIGVEVDGVLKATVSVPNTGWWQTYQTVTLPGIAVSAGSHIVKIRMHTGSSSDPNAGFNLNYLRFI